MVDWYGRILFYYFIDKEIVEFLVNNGVDIYVGDFEGKILLFLVVLDGYEEVVGFFIKRGSDVNKRGDFGDILFYEVAIRGYINIV